MSHPRAKKVALLFQLIISYGRGELTAVKPHKALMIPKEDFTTISNHAFENNVAKMVRYILNCIMGPSEEDLLSLYGKKFFQQVLCPDEVQVRPSCITIQTVLLQL